MPATRESTICRYHYDPLDRLAALGPSTEVDARLFYLKDRLFTEDQGEVKHTLFQHDNRLLAQQRRDNNAVSTKLLATDLQRSVLRALDATRIHPLAYTPYGHHSPDSGLLSLPGFNGERRDPVTGHYLLGNGYRAFNPVLMRFNSADRLSPFDKGGMNSYAYCAGSPMTRVDPSGASWLALLGQGVGTALNVIFAGAAINRAAAAIVSGAQQSILTRVGNVGSFLGGAASLPSRMLGIPGAVNAAVPTSVPTLASNLGVIGGQVLTGAGALAQNYVIAQKWWAAAGANGQSRGRVLWEALKEASGWNLLRRQPPGKVSGRSSDVSLQQVVTPPSPSPDTRDPLGQQAQRSAHLLRRNTL
ncbi:RHS repeat-associated core domain-containing protein [Pseudomonas akapageensis]|uniref:RHS repeat-associated core domain-containing protein n=1 Tax=Pseudomonas akapageensis TaxID=2609961 RepID=UPI00140BFFA1|nr:RHS repeat-associated core domain-containing protein [Pseudomonas akapageensis]